MKFKTHSDRNGELMFTVFATEEAKKRLLAAGYTPAIVHRDMKGHSGDSVADSTMTPAPIK